MSPASRSTRYKMQPSAMHRVDDTPDDLEAVHGIHRFGTVHAEATDGQALPSRRSRADTSASAERCAAVCVISQVLASLSETVDQTRKALIKKCLW